MTNRYSLLALLYYGLISLASHIPGKTLSHIGFNFWDKGVHFVVYFILGCLLYLSFFEAARRRPAVALVFAVGIVLFLGTLDELHQLFVSGRDASLGDAVADTLGGTVGGLLVFYRRRTTT